MYHGYITDTYFCPQSVLLSVHHGYIIDTYFYLQSVLLSLYHGYITDTYFYLQSVLPSVYHGCITDTYFCPQFVLLSVHHGYITDTYFYLQSVLPSVSRIYHRYLLLPSVCTSINVSRIYLSLGNLSYSDVNAMVMLFCLNTLRIALDASNLQYKIIHFTCTFNSKHIHQIVR